MFIEMLRSPATLFALFMAAALLLAAGVSDAQTVAEVVRAGRAH